MSRPPYRNCLTLNFTIPFLHHFLSLLYFSLSSLIYYIAIYAPSQSMRSPYVHKFTSTSYNNHPATRKTCNRFLSQVTNGICTIEIFTSLPSFSQHFQSSHKHEASLFHSHYLRYSPSLTSFSPLHRWKNSRAGSLQDSKKAVHDISRKGCSSHVRTRIPIPLYRHL